MAEIDIKVKVLVVEIISLILIVRLTLIVMYFLWNKTVDGEVLMSLEESRIDLELLLLTEWFSSRDINHWSNTPFW